MYPTEREIEVHGVKVLVVDYETQSFYYPKFNYDVEFKVSSKGFRKLSHYIRMVKRYTNWFAND